LPFDALQKEVTEFPVMCQRNGPTPPRVSLFMGASASAKGPINYNAIYYISSITSMRNELVELIHKLITNPIIFQE
jgi:hypothetical protein